MENNNNNNQVGMIDLGNALFIQIVEAANKFRDILIQINGEMVKNQQQGQPKQTGYNEINPPKH